MFTLTNIACDTDERKQKMTLLYEKIREILKVLKGHITVESMPIDGISVSPCGYKTGNFPSPDAVWTPYNGKSLDANPDDHFWFKFTVDVPEAEEGYEYRLAAITGHEGQWDAKNPQSILYVDGATAYQAFDVNHTEAVLTPGRHDILIYHYVGLEPTDGTSTLRLTLNKTDLAAETLWYDMYTPFEALGCLAKDTHDYNTILNTLERAEFIIDFRHFGSEEYRRSLIEAHNFMKREFYEKICGKNDYRISLIGHTHIDVAWLWTLAQTREKAQRSFSTVIRLMEKYPDYKFMSSQPQLYEYVKESDPELYAKIKERVREGRWEVEGAMWLEADTNLVSGESLVRQLLLGKRFMREEFGKDNRILWLPDVFGYSGALPQILKKSGVDYFFTTKLNWNETNKPDDDNFTWQGIDGSRVFAVLASCYVTKIDAPTLKYFWDGHKTKKYTDVQIQTFGYGDGGGGPTADMLEKYDRLKYGLPGLPKAEIRFAGETVNEIKEKFDKSVDELRFEPKRCGELYFEMHRGTYTSIAKNKKNNRKSELLYQALETAAVADAALLGESAAEYPTALIDKSWHTILRNQFHDIIPGSSIKQVYDDSDIEYAEVLGEGMREFDGRLSHLAANTSEGGTFVYNPSPFTADGIVKGADGKNAVVKGVPSHGWKVVRKSEDYSPVTVGDRFIENDYVKVSFNEKYEIVSVYDKKRCREAIEEGKKANELQVFEDYPASYDAWELSEYYSQKMWTADDLTKVETISEGTVGGFEVIRRYGNSVITQKILLTAISPRVDFVTDVDWHEDHVILKAAFPTTVYTDRVNCDIQFGHLSRPTQRNNRFDEAMFEMCMHKWADISENGCGVSLLNDCKYGVNVEENVMKISLLKAPTYPNPDADRGHHSFTYSLYVHGGELSGTVREGYLLNMPLIAKAAVGGGELPSEYGLVRSSNPAFVVETIKRAEDGNGLIIRGYESLGGKASTELSFGVDAGKAYLCDLMENIESEAEVRDGKVKLNVSNFEIVTLRIDV